MAVTAGVNMQALVQDDFLPVTKTSSFLTEELLPQAANMLQQFRDKLDRNMNEPQLWVHSDELYAMVTDKKPFINGAFVGLFINNIWSPFNFTSSRCDLSTSMNLFLWCPADQQSHQYAKEEGDVVTEQNDARMSQGKAKIGRSLPVGKVHGSTGCYFGTFMDGSHSRHNHQEGEELRTCLWPTV